MWLTEGEFIFQKKDIFIVSMLFALLSISVHSQSVETQDVVNDFVLEITREGKGMVFPLKKQVYFRLYSDGKLEYEVPPEFNPEVASVNWELKHLTTYLTEKDVRQIVRLAEKSDFLKLDGFYQLSQQYSDAIMKTTIVYKNKVLTKTIVINNVQLKSPEAKKHYPSPLIKLLNKIVELRPKTDEEIKYKWGELY